MKEYTESAANASIEMIGVFKTQKWKGVFKMRTLFASFSGVGEFEGWMIAKLNFRHMSKESEEVLKEKSKAAVLRQKARYAILESEDDTWQIQMHLIKPKEQKEENKKFLEKKWTFGEEITKWRIAREEILDFVISVNDWNPIHRTEHAIVPGFLFAEKLWKDPKIADQIEEWNAFELIFYHPAYEEEAISLLKEKKTGSIWAFAEREKKPILLWECRKKEKIQE